MNKLLEHPIFRFLIGGTILSLATHLANSGSPLLAGIFVTVPLELVSLFFIKKNKLHDYAKSILVMSISTIVTVLYYYLIQPTNHMSSNMEILSAFILWLTIGISIFYWKK